MGRRRQGHPRRTRSRPRDHGDLLPEAAASGRHSRLRRLSRDAREGDRYPGRRQHHARPPAREYQHRRAQEGQGGNLAQAGGERALRGTADVAGRARELGRVAPARLQQQPGSAHARGVDPGRGDWHRARSAQLDRPAVLAAGHAGVPRVGAGGARWFQLGAVAGAGARTSLPSELHLRGLSRLVRLRHRLSGRHGALQPVAALPHPEPRRAGVGRGPAEQRGVGQREERQHRWPGLDRRLPAGEHVSAGGTPPPPVVRLSTRSGTTAG